MVDQHSHSPRNQQGDHNQLSVEHGAIMLKECDAAIHLNADQYH